MTNSTRLSRTSRRTYGSRRRGSATVEMAILLPMLVTLGLICCDYGRFVHRYIAVTNAARAGAEYAIMHPATTATKPAWDAGVRAAVQEELAGNNWFDSSKLTVVTPTSTNESLGMRRVRVEATYPFNTLIPWPLLPGYNSTRTLRQVVVMRGIR